MYTSTKDNLSRFRRASQSSTPNPQVSMSKQDQFLDVIDRDEAEARFRKAIVLEPVGSEEIALSHALGRVLCEDIVADIDVPSFDRSNFSLRSII